MEVMYFLTSIAILENNQKYSRCFGYFTTKQKAFLAAKNNTGNMIEAFYDFLVIEFIGEGIHALSKEIAWFEYNLDKNSWIECKKPKWSNGIVNWAIG